MQPLLQGKSDKYYVFRVCVCSLSYRACNALAPCLHLWSVLFCNTFPRYKRHHFRIKEVIESKIFFILSTDLSEKNLILTRTERDMT